MRWKKKTDGRIFISYRRSDAQGVAGRLEDSLEAYFGGNRVFRDVEDITGGADFGEVIDHTLTATDAMIVLIGPNWLSAAGPGDLRRLDQPGDWVASEIAAAIEHGIPIYPVLIENTPMPREHELPEKLRPLLRFNALSITDRRWQFDVQRLGKIISLDVPSANERKIDLIRFGISVALCASLVLTAAIIARNYLCQMCTAAAVCAPGERFCAPELCSLWQAGGACNLKLIERWQSGIPFVVIVASSLMILSIVGLVAEDRQRYLYAAIGVGTLGALFFYSFQLALGSSEEAMVGFFGATLLVTLMLVLMNMSGFEAK